MSNPYCPDDCPSPERDPMPTALHSGDLLAVFLNIEGDVPRAQPRQPINRNNTMDTKQQDNQARSTLAAG